MAAAYGFSITVAMLMTTTLMFYFMKFVKKWPAWVITIILLVFLTVESSFFLANIAKLAQRWKFLIFEITIVFIMYIWYKARKITNRFLQFENIQPHIPDLLSLSKDISETKYATHLVYMTKANNPKNIEKRIIESILYKRPKRADIYWFVHIDRADDPYTMEYTVEEIVPDKIIRINLKLGFRVQPRINLFFKKVLCELATNNPRLDIHLADICYVIIKRILSVENEFSLKEGFILNSYFTINNLAQSDKKAFGLDIADVSIENAPLVVTPIQNVPLIKSAF